MVLNKYLFGIVVQNISHLQCIVEKRKNNFLQCRVVCIFVFLAHTPLYNPLLSWLFKHWCFVCCYCYGPCQFVGTLCGSGMQRGPLFDGQFLCNSSGHNTIISTEFIVEILKTNERKMPACNVCVWAKISAKSGKCVDAYIYKTSKKEKQIHVVLYPLLTHSFVCLYGNCMCVCVFACINVYATYETPIKMKIEILNSYCCPTEYFLSTSVSSCLVKF